MSRTKIDEVTLNALRTRQSLVKGERLVRHDMRPVLIVVRPTQLTLLTQNERDGRKAENEMETLLAWLTPKQTP